MQETASKPVRAVAYYTPEQWERLRVRLFEERKTYAEWAREQADAYLSA